VPALAWLGVFFVYPIGQLFYASLFTPAFSLGNYAKLVGSPVYLKVFVNTFEISVTVTLITLVLGYPLAFLLATADRRARDLMLVAIICPLTSVLVRTYAWMVPLLHAPSRRSPDPGSLTRPALLYTASVTMAWCVLLPFMVLLIYSVMKGIDVERFRAAKNLGANRRQAFLRVYLPLSLSGLATGCLVVFVTALGFFVTPALLGGRGDMMIAMLIDVQVSQLLDWGLGSALAVVLFAVTAAILLAVQRLTGAERMWVRVP
jgi:ABC-type spermidine/putrescine transport system permease subunit I